jgi:hypothetical protein
MAADANGLHRFRFAFDEFCDNRVICGQALGKIMSYRGKEGFSAVSPNLLDDGCDRLFGHLPLGDVAHNSLQSSVWQLPPRDFTGEQRAILAAHSPVASDYISPTQAFQLTLNARDFLMRDYVRDREFQNLLNRISQQTSASGVHVQISASRVTDENAVGSLLDQ